MKFLIDNALSPIVAGILRQHGYETAHVRDFSMQAASDEEIFNLAIREDYVVVSADTDFGTLLALRGSVRPSFVLFRRLKEFHGPQTYARVLLDNLNQITEDLKRGAVVTFDRNTLRIRPLPIGSELPTLFR